MRLNELRELIVNSNDDYWNKLRVGPFYHDRILVEGDHDFHGTSHSHFDRAVLLDDVNVSLEWGLEHESEEDSTFPWRDFPDSKVRSILVDVFYAGSLVDRSVLYVVDGGRAYLPEWSNVRIDDGEPQDFEHAEWEYRVDRWDFLLAQLLNQLAGRPDSDYESYFIRSGLVRAEY